jgi:hypothetical protein
MKRGGLYAIAVAVAFGAVHGCHWNKGSTMDNLRVRVERLDYAPEELVRQAPFDLTFVRVLRGPDRPDYMLFSLGKPVSWKGERATHMVLCARWVGTSIGPKVRDLPVNIAVVRDQALLSSSDLRFEQADYAAIGVATDVSADRR